MAPPLTVLLHGQPGSRLDWQLVLPLLRDFDVDARDRPGYDGSPGGGFFYGAQRLLQRTGERDLLLVGYSWGAGVAVAAAARRADLVRGLVLVCPVGSPAAISWADRLLTHALVAQAFGLTMRAALPRLPVLLGRAVGSRLGPEAKLAVRNEVRSRDPATVSAAWLVEQRALVAETPLLSACLGEIRAPTLVLAGTRDTSIRPSAAHSVAQLIPKAEFRLISAGHLMPFEAPQAVASAIRDLHART